MPKNRGNPKLTDAQKTFICRELACYSTISEVIRKFQDRWDRTLTKQHVDWYNPEHHERLAKKWRDIFYETREAFLGRFKEHLPLSNKAVRIQKLSMAAMEFERKGNYVAMAEMLERIAKEMGNVHTNKRQITGKDEGPVQFEDVSMMSRDEIDAEITELLNGAKRASVQPAPEQEQ